MQFQLMRLKQIYLIALTTIDLLPEKRGVKDPKHWFIENKQTFVKGVMVIAEFSYNENVTISKVEKMFNNSDYFEKFALAPFFQKKNLLTQTILCYQLLC